jgi:hypothetical protein
METMKKRAFPDRPADELFCVSSKAVNGKRTNCLVGQLFAGFIPHHSHWILISFSTALNSGSPVTSSAFLSLARAAAKQSA